MDDDYIDDDYIDDDYQGGGGQDDDYASSPPVFVPAPSSSSGSNDDDYEDDDDYRGSGFDGDDDYRGGTSSLGFVDDDYARRLFGDDDYITGQRIRKRDLNDDDYSFLPSSTNRFFEGGRRRDTLSGTGNGVEVFIGRSRDDNFLLGNRRDDFYDDDYRRGGRSSYGLVKDFSFRQDDTIFLHGNRRDYTLSTVRIDGIRGVGIVLEGGRRDNLIGVIQGQRPGAFDLSDSSAFQFFGG